MGADGAGRSHRFAEEPGVVPALFGLRRMPAPRVMAAVPSARSWGAGDYQPAQACLSFPSS